MRTRLILILSLLLGACAVQPPAQVRVEQGWIAAIPPMLRVTAALMTLHNDGDSPRYLVGASSPNAGSIEVHRSIVVDEVAKMIQQKELEIPAGESLAFSNQSGYHLMLYEATGLEVGRMIPITLKFRDGSEVTVDFEVRDRRRML